MNQAQLFYIFSLTGILLGLLFDIFRILRKSFKTSDWVTYIEDSLFLILAGLLLFYTIYKFNNGEYIYDRHIRCEYNTGSSSYTVTVLSPQGESIKSFTVSDDEFNSNKWNY